MVQVEQATEAVANGQGAGGGAAQAANAMPPAGVAAPVAVAPASVLASFLKQANLEGNGYLAMLAAAGMGEPHIHCHFETCAIWGLS